MDAMTNAMCVGLDFLLPAESLFTIQVEKADDRLEQATKAFYEARVGGDQREINRAFAIMKDAEKKFEALCQMWDDGYYVTSQAEHDGFSLDEAIMVPEWVDTREGAILNGMTTWGDYEADDDEELAYQFPHRDSSTDVRSRYDLREDYVDDAVEVIPSEHVEEEIPPAQEKKAEPVSIAKEMESDLAETTINKAIASGKAPVAVYPLRVSKGKGVALVFSPRELLWHLDRGWWPDRAIVEKGKVKNGT